MNRTFLHTLLLCLLLAACGREIEPGVTPGQGPVVRGLTLETVVPSGVPEGEAFVGTVESSGRAVLAARTDGRVGPIVVREGESVRPGQLLLTIEGNPALHRLSEAEGASRAADARLKLAEQTKRRYRQLFAKEAVTPQEMDRVSAELEMARQHRRSAVAAAETAQTALDYTRVRAPWAGRLLRREVEEGATVQPGTPLLVLERQGEWRVRARLPEALLSQVVEGEAIRIEIPALGKSLAGTITEILPAADPQSRSFEIKGAIPAERGLAAGMYARVNLAGEMRGALLVPAAAVVQRGQLNGLYVAEEDVLHYRMVKTGRRLGDQVEILSGLAAGEKIVTAGVERARDRARVEE